MGCVRSKEDKGPALKYRPDNSNATPASVHQGPYGPDPTLMGHSPAMKMHNNSYNSHGASLTPFGGASSIMTPFGGASTSFTSVAVGSPFPSVITGQSTEIRVILPKWLFTGQHGCLTARLISSNITMQKRAPECIENATFIWLCSKEVSQYMHFFVHHKIILPTTGLE